MTSKEALNEIRRDGVFAKESINGFVVDKKKTMDFDSYCQVILQALERLEQLEKENQELKDEIEKESKLSTRATKAYLEKNAENEKLEKAISILKDKFELELINEELHFNTYECDTREIHELYDEWFYNLTQQEYELLKEVLGNE